MTTNPQKTILTGVKPTGLPHLDNNLGSIRPSLALSGSNAACFFIADGHALTTIKAPQELADMVYAAAASMQARRQLSIYNESRLASYTASFQLRSRQIELLLAGGLI